MSRNREGASLVRTYERTIARLRIRLGLWIVGGDLLGAVTLLQLIAERAKRCITPDGHVILAECKPLADALYAQTPGHWTLTLTYRAEESHE